MQKKICCILLSFIMLAEIVVPVRATTISGVKKEQQKTQNTLDQVNNQIQDISKDKVKADAELEQANSQLVDILTSIDVCKDEIAVKEKEIEQAKVDLAEAEKKEADQYENMKLRIRFMYEQGDKAYVQVLMEAGDYSDMVNKAEYIEQLYEYDRKLLANFVQSKEDVKTLKGKLEDEEAGLQASNRELEQEQAVMEQMVAEKQQTVENFGAQLASAQKKASECKKQLESQTAKLKKMEEEAAAAKKKAEEEAERKKQQAEKDKNNNTTNTNTDTNNTTSSDVNVGGSSNTNTSTNQFNAGAGNVTGDSSGLGQQVANYACQFVGNPYVFGGTSLTSGTDCSGFTQAVYAHFGISIPRDSFSQRNSGTAVDYADARPGDIICYAGHVALYLGNGSIVHASTERTGITYGYATYRTILGVRRIVQ